MKEAKKEAQREKAEEGRKKFKPTLMDKNASVPTNTEASPLPFALEKMCKYEHVEMWYFGLKGCKEARLSSFAESSSGYILAAFGDNVAIALRALSSFTKSTKAITDKRSTSQP